LGWFSAIFNFPDMFIVCGTVFTAICFLINFFKSAPMEKK
jgi:lipoprotein signal peptidase